MKNLGGVFIMVFILAVFSCGDKDYKVTITKDTAKQVSYSYNGSTDVLSGGVGASKTYQVKAYTPPPEDVKELGTEIASIKTEGKNGGETYAFTDAACYALYVFNTLGIPVTFKADNYIDNGGSTELTVARLSSTITPVDIYTAAPNFTSKTDGLAFEWILIDGVMSLTIKAKG